MKKLLKLTIVVTILIAFNLTTFGQQFGIKASGGISRIYGSLGIDNFNSFPNSTSPSSSSFSSSFQAGLYYQLPMGKRTSLGAELLYSKVQGAQTLKWSEPYFDGTASYTIYEDVSYMSLPIYLGLTFNRVTFNAGFQISHALSSAAENKVLFLHDGKEEELANSQSPNFPVRNLDFGPRAGINYQLNNRLSLEGMFYYGLGDISYPKSENTELKIQQMTVGLRYALKDKQADNLTSFANQQFGIKASGGLSKITNSIKLLNVTPTTPFVPSGQIGLFYSCPLNKKSSLGAEFLFSQIEGKDILKMNLTDINRNKVGFSSDVLYRHISYLSIPVYYGYTFKWLTIHGGLQVSYALASSGREKSDILLNEAEEYRESTNLKVNDINITKFDFGPRAGMIYQLNSKLAVEGTYYYGLTNILKGGSPVWKLKVQQMTVGVRYSLWSN